MKCVLEVKKQAVLASVDEFGAVTNLRGGSIIIRVREHQLSVSETDYWLLMEMLSTASQRLAAVARGAS